MCCLLGVVSCALFVVCCLLYLVVRYFVFFVHCLVCVAFVKCVRVVDICMLRVACCM